MLPEYYLSTALIFSGVVIAAPPVIVSKSPVSLALSRRVNTTSIHNLARHDKRRANGFRSLRSASKSGTFSSRQDAAAPENMPVDNQAVTYLATLNVGTPARPYSLIVDTGSSNTWIGADNGYLSTSGKLRADLVKVDYGSGNFIGAEFTDVVSLRQDVFIANQSIGSAVASKGFNGVDGILGYTLFWAVTDGKLTKFMLNSIGPTDLTLGTMVLSPTEQIPTIVDNLFYEKKIPRYEVGIYFQATNADQPISNGELTFGGTDSSKYIGPITYTPVTQTLPAGYYWGIDQSITYGNTTLLSSRSPGIVDTGTTLILIASDGYQTYINATGAVSDSSVGLLKLSLSQYSNLLDMVFTIEKTEFRLIPDAQIWPRTLNTDLGGTTDVVYLMIGDIGMKSGSGMDFVNGFAFLERFYSVFDTENRLVGIANTPATQKIINF